MKPIPPRSRLLNRFFVAAASVRRSRSRNPEPRRKVAGAALLLIFFAIPAASADTALRHIKIIAAASPAFKQNPEWQKDIVERVGYANKVFEKTFGIHFSVEQYKNWEPGDETRGMPLLVEELKSFPLASGDHMVIGFHKMSRAVEQEKMEDMETVGTAAFFRGRIALRDPFGEWGQAQSQTVLVHELAHLFGAVHVSDPAAIMNASLPQFPSEQIDPENRQIIQQTRNVDFQKGLDSFPPEILDSLIAVYEKLIRANPHSDFYYHLGHFYRKRNLEARAIAVWEEALRYHYDNPLIHYELGVHYHQAGLYDRAVQELGSAAAHFILDSQKKIKADTLNLLGGAYFEKDHMDQAVFTWLQGLAADPDNPNLQGNLAAAYLKRGDLDRGLAELEKLHVKYPEDAVVLSNLGTVSMQKKQYDKAAYYFSQALEKSTDAGAEKREGLLNPVPEWILRMDLGQAYLEMKEMARALHELERAKILNPADADLRKALGRVYLFQQDYRKAEEELGQALRLRPKDPAAHALLGQAYAETHNRTQALAAAREAIRYSDDKIFQAAMHKNRGAIYGQDGNSIKALEEFKLAVSLDWNDAEAHYNLGLIYLNQQNAEEAKRSLQTALRIRPDFAQAKEMLANLEKGKRG